MSIKALTICQPYAEWIARGDKIVENRVWSTTYRGLVAIHAGQSRSWLDKEPPEAVKLQFGAIIAVARLVDCVAYKREQGGKPPREYDWLISYAHAHGPVCWVLEDVRRLEKPVTCAGRQGLWDLTPGELTRLEVELRKLERKES